MRQSTGTFSLIAPAQIHVHITRKTTMKSLVRCACLGCLSIAVFAQGSGSGQAGGAQNSPNAQAAGGQSSAAGQAAGGQSSQTGQAGSASVPAADKKFAMMVAQTDLAEIQLGNMALQKSTDPKVKQVAQKLVDDHTKSSTALKEIAAKKGLTLPTETDAKHKALATKLEGESGADFDKHFLDANSKDHHKVVQAFQKESSNGKDPDIKQFAAQFLPAIQEHTTMIDQARGQTGGTQ
jgi:putative membrane protein